MALEIRIAIEVVLFVLLAWSVWWGYSSVRKALRRRPEVPVLPDDADFQRLVEQHEKLASMRKDNT